MTITIATWNINSVRLRKDLLKRLIKAANPDVVCLQETKVADELFPRQAIADLGYAHQAILGQKGYHGVAILSRLPFSRTAAIEFCEKKDARHVSVTLPNAIELHNFYVPAGADVPDPKLNEKFAHKLRFLEEMESVFSKMKNKRASRRVIVGDLNVAPYENDVWSHKQLLDVVSHTPAETERLGKAFAAHDWIDVTRSRVPLEKKIFSWWSYRNRDWRLSDRGRRLDHIWVGQGLKGAVSAHAIHKDARDWPQPSDHVPVVATIDS